MKVTKRSNPYLGAQDNAEFIHHHKTHRSASEAFRDADYATPIWRDRSDIEEALDFLGGSVWGGLVVIIPFSLVIYVLHWITTK
jgi:hypothetical protein